MKLVLLGYMGVGKSTLGKLLAQTFNLKFIDLDQYIEDQEKLSIPELFREKGEIYFRKKESEYLGMLLSQDDDYVLSLGGGTPVYANNMESVLNTKDVVSVYLKLDFKELTNRLYAQKDSRPLVAHYTSKADFEDFIRKHLFERQSYYFLAHHVLNLTDKDENESLEELIQMLNQNV